MTKISCIFALSLLCSASAFTTPVTSSRRHGTSLNMANEKDDSSKMIAKSMVAAAFLASNVLFSDSAMAFSPDFGGSTEIVAGRSGGRGGGRASSGRSSMRSSGYSSGYSAGRAAGSTTVVRPTVISRPSVIVAPGMGMGMGYGYGYSPLGMGLGAVGQIGRDMNDMNQEREIQRSRAELDQAKMREQELSQRLSALEMQQGRAPSAQYMAPPPQYVAPPLPVAPQ